MKGVTEAHVAEWRRRGLLDAPAPLPGSVARLVLPHRDGVGGDAGRGLVFEERGPLTVSIGVKTKNPTNTREDWWIVSKRAKAEHKAVESALMGHEGRRDEFAAGCIARLTRVSNGTLDPVDSLGPALKAVKDSVARWLLGGTIGQLDMDPRIAWELRQRKMGAGVYGVIITLEAT